MPYYTPKSVRDKIAQSLAKHLAATERGTPERFLLESFAKELADIFEGENSAANAVKFLTSVGVSNTLGI